MNSSNLYKISKTSIFKKLKRLLYKYYPRSVKAYKNKSNSS